MKKTGDILSQCRHVEEKLARLASIVECSSDAIISKTLDGVITSWNRGAENLYGYVAGEAIGKHITILTPADRQHEVPAILEKLKLGERVEHFETVRVRKDGRQIHISLTISPILDPSGKIVGASAIERDITERKRAEAEIERMNQKMAAWTSKLEAANAELEAFNYTVSHDLYTPLTAINGYVQVIRDACGTRLDPQCRGYLEEIYSGSLRMTNLIDSLLNFSRLTRVELRNDTINLSGIAKKLADELMLAEPGRKATFRIAEGITVKGDPVLLGAVLQNLLGNAWKYTAGREEAVIEIGVTMAESGNAYFVRDNGLGFDTKHADKLFVPFKRLPGAEHFAGEGIGLATVERIISRHGGRVWAEGKPGEGATFYFTLADCEAASA